MDDYQRAVGLLPPPLQAALSAVSDRAHVQDIHLRGGQAVSVGCGVAEWFVTANGELTVNADDAVQCSAEMLSQTAARLMQYSVYTHREELRRGFVTTEGCRVGVAGTAVVENGEVVGYRSLTSLCLRVAREHNGCAVQLASVLFDDGVQSALIVSEPSGGKTSLLRDLAREAARRRLTVSVVDERGELSGLSPLIGCDVLCGTPKAEGVEQAIRCLSPRVVLLDELGNGDELRAVHDAAVRGVPTIATVHARSTDELKRRAALWELLQNVVFDYTVLLRGRHDPGAVASILPTKEWVYGNTRSGVAPDNGHRIRRVGTPCLTLSHHDAGTL